jgi:hypothetical protein
MRAGTVPGRHLPRERQMLFDVLIAVLIVVVAAILGLVVHPILWVIVIAAALWLFGRRRVRA